MELKWNFKKKSERKEKRASNNPYVPKEREEFNEEECFQLATSRDDKNTKAVTAASAAVKATNELKKHNNEEITREKMREEKHAPDFEFSLNIRFFF